MIEFQAYLGKPYNLGLSDCYSLVREYYRVEYGVVLNNYARPNAWDSNPSMNLLRDNFDREGFVDTNNSPNKVQKGDILLMNLLKSNNDNHVAVYVGHNKILQHLAGRVSELTHYDHAWRHRVRAVLRHPVVDSVSSMDGLKMFNASKQPPHLRRGNHGDN